MIFNQTTLSADPLDPSAQAKIEESVRSLKRGCYILTGSQSDSVRKCEREHGDCH